MQCAMARSKSMLMSDSARAPSDLARNMQTVRTTWLEDVKSEDGELQEGGRAQPIDHDRGDGHDAGHSASTIKQGNASGAAGEKVAAHAGEGVGKDAIERWSEVERARPGSSAADFMLREQNTRHTHARAHTHSRHKTVPEISTAFKTPSLVGVLKTSEKPPEARRDIIKRVQVLLSMCSVEVFFSTEIVRGLSRRNAAFPLTCAVAC